MRMHAHAHARLLDAQAQAHAYMDNAHTRTHTHTLRTHTNTHLRKRLRAYACMHAHNDTHARTRTLTHKHAHAPTWMRWLPVHSLTPRKLACAASCRMTSSGMSWPVTACSVGMSVHSSGCYLSLPRHVPSICRAASNCMTSSVVNGDATSPHMMKRRTHVLSRSCGHPYFRTHTCNTSPLPHVRPRVCTHTHPGATTNPLSTLAS